MFRGTTTENLMTLDKPIVDLVKQYISLRERKSNLAKQYEEKKARIENDMNDISELLMSHLKTLDATSINTPAGMIIRSVKTRYWASDWESMHEFIRENNVPEFYEKRLNQGQVRAFLEENPEAAVPGLNVDSTYSLTVRRSK